METCQYCKFPETAGHAVRNRLICKNKTGSKGLWHIVDHGWHCDNFSSKAPAQPIGTSRIAHIPLTQGKVAIIDAEDYPQLCRYYWQVVKKRTNCYARRIAHPRPLPMHRQIVSPPANMVVDHINRNGLDNRKANLRICTPAENSWNHPGRPNRKSAYKGVHWLKRDKKYCVRICCNGNRITVGCYHDEAKAGRAYDAKARELFGEFAYLNFPDDEQI